VGLKLRFMLDVRRLQVLCAVADAGTVTAAAASLSYTPSAVSQQLATLEREAGTRLVHRGPRGTRLTLAGHELVDHARAILTRLSVAQASLDAIAGLRGGRLRLASFATAGATLLPAAVAAFRERFPEVELTLAQANPDDALALLRAGELDLAITAEGVDGDADGLEVHHLLDDPLRVVLPRTHPLAASEAVALTDLADEVWVDAAAGSEARRLLLWACRRAGFRPRVAFESDDYAAVQELVAAAVGVALVPELALRRPPHGVVARPLAVPVVRHITAATHTGDFRSPAADAMLALLDEVVAARPASG
jgi:DNA-binding transcriptional LysR family regulator